MSRTARLASAIGDHAANIDPEEHLRSVINLFEPDDLCACGEQREALALWCPGCGEPTFSAYAPISDGHGLHVRPRASRENPARSVIP